MIKSIYLLSCALTFGQAADRLEWHLTPQLAPGLELVYTGSYAEESLIPNVKHQRQYRLDASVLILDAGVKDWQAAIMTTLSLQEARQPNDKKDGPASVRLEMARIDVQGRVRSGAKKLLEIPLKTPPTLEIGFLVPAPNLRVGRNSSWDLGDDKSPAHRWQVVGTEGFGGVTCIKVAGLQQSLDWDAPRADQTAWRRRDLIWLHPQLMVALKVERIIERRDPARDTPTHHTVVRYELDSRLQYPGLLFEDRKKEILKASKFHDDAQQLLRQPGLHRQQIDGLIQRVSYHLDHQPATQSTPYRKAVVHIKAVLEKAQKGEVPVPGTIEDAPLPASITLAIGDRVPDFAVSSLSEEKTVALRHLQEKPIIVMFYNPATPLGKEVMTYAKRLNEKQTGKLGIMAMALTQDAEIARKQHKDMRLPFPILDGNAMRLTFGADQTPRFVVVDSEGLVRLTLTGWGYHTPYEIDEALQKCQKR
ncbi:MAG: redoxin domain-containing protein [Gemmataceae bacterium]|nr:redoxin domain-containing protein [Gemmataceae bacterium]